jgi:hypothetical protein
MNRTLIVAALLIAFATGVLAYGVFAAVHMPNTVVARLH